MLWNRKKVKCRNICQKISQIPDGMILQTECDRMSEYMPDGMPEQVPDRVTNRMPAPMSEDMSNRMSTRKYVRGTSKQLRETVVEMSNKCQKKCFVFFAQWFLVKCAALPICSMRCPVGSRTLGLGSSIFTDCGCIDGSIDVSTSQGWPFCFGMV